MNVVAYLRLSKKSSEGAGLGLDSQREYIATAAKANGWQVVAEFIDDGVSGTVHPLERPAASQAFTYGLPVVVAKLDRLSRDVEHIAGMMKRADFRVATMPTASTIELHLFAVLAQQEREFIAQRTKDALQALQQRADDGDAQALQKVASRAEYLAKGRTDANRAKAQAAIAGRVSTFHDTVRPHFEACLFRGLSTLRSVADCLNSRGVTTSRGNQWSATQVARVMSALDLEFPLSAYPLHTSHTQAT